MIAEGIPVGDVYMLPVCIFVCGGGEEKGWRGGGEEERLIFVIKCVVIFFGIIFAPPTHPHTHTHPPPPHTHTPKFLQLAPKPGLFVLKVKQSHAVLHEAKAVIF